MAMVKMRRTASAASSLTRKPLGVTSSQAGHVLKIGPPPCRARLRACFQPSRRRCDLMALSSWGAGEDNQRLDELQGVCAVRQILTLRLEGDDGDAEVLQAEEELQGRADLIAGQPIEAFHDQHAATWDPGRYGTARFEEAGQRPFPHVVSTEGRDAKIVQ